MESGLPDYEVNGWYGLLGPRGMQRAIVDRLNHALAQVLADRETQAKFAANGMVPAAGSADDFAALIRKEITKWSKVVRTAGIKAE